MTPTDQAIANALWPSSFLFALPTSPRYVPVVNKAHRAARQRVTRLKLRVLEGGRAQ